MQPAAPGTARSKNKKMLRRGLSAGVAAVVMFALLPSLSEVAVAAPSAPTAPSEGLWDSTTFRAGPSNGHSVRVDPEDYQGYALDNSGMQSLLEGAPDEGTPAAAKAPLEVSLPAPDGNFARFAISDSPMMQEGLAADNPDITTYAGRGIDDPSASIRLDMTPMGFHASVRGPEGQGSWYIDPRFNGDDSVYVSYFGRDLPEPKGTFVENEAVEDSTEALKNQVADDVVPGEVVLKTYRLALLTDPSYANYFGTENVLAEKVTLINRVNQVYNDDLAIRLVLINESDKLNLDTPAKATEPNGPCGSAACFTPAQLASCGALSRNRIVLGQLVGAGKYDIGHLGLGVNGGGVASLGVVGGNSKAQGCTGLPQPEGDFYAVDYVAHEMGHQFSGNHTFNGTQYNCSTGNRNASTSVEPGSGSSVMAYAGICQQDNLQPHSDPYFSQRSIQEITTYVTSERPNITEVQTVSLRDFDTDGESFTLSFNGATTEPIVRGVNYSTIGIKAAIEAITGPEGMVTVAPFGGGSGVTLNDTGFQVTFAVAVDRVQTGALAGQNLESMGLNLASGDVTGFVGETAQGGPIQNGGFTQETFGDHAPVVVAPVSKMIPVRTPFALTGSATDSDGDPLTYLWEQNDVGATGRTSGTGLVTNAKTNGPLFRQFGTAAVVTPAGTLQTPSPGENQADGNSTRVFPDMAQILANNTNADTGACPTAPDAPATGGASNVPSALVDCYSEYLPTADYVGTEAAGNTEPSINFRLTARDLHANGGGTGNADVKLTLAPAAGPFLVSSRNGVGTAVVAGRSENVVWSVAGTALPELAMNVTISLSTDGGQTFPLVLAKNTPNDGSELIKWPSVGTGHARLKIEAVDNYFFDVNNNDFSIVDKTAPETTITKGRDDGDYVLNNGPTFRYAADEAGSSFDCMVDGKSTACGDSSVKVGKLKAGTHDFAVAATDQSGNVDATPATRFWTVPHNDRALRVVKGWSRHSGARAYEGTFSVAKKKGATLSIAARGVRQIVLIGGTQRNAGKVKVYLNGELLKKVNLQSSVVDQRQVFPVATFDTPRSGRINVVSTSKKKVRVEGLGMSTRMPQ